MHRPESVGCHGRPQTLRTLTVGLRLRSCRGLMVARRPSTLNALGCVSPSWVPFMVLLVDDNNDTLDLCTVGLSLHGFRVRVASDANEALDLITVRAPKIVVTDLCMPGV